MADFCYHEAFCPVECDYATEKKCSGEYDSNAGKKISADTCISMKNGECENHCPVFCSEGQTLCPGMIFERIGGWTIVLTIHLCT